MRSYAVAPDALRRLRDERGMSLRDLQLMTGLSWSFVKYVAKGERNLSDTTALLFSFALGVDIEKFTISVRRGGGNSRVAA